MRGSDTSRRSCCCSWATPTSYNRARIRPRRSSAPSRPDVINRKLPSPWRRHSNAKMWNNSPTSSPTCPPFSPWWRMMNQSTRLTMMNRTPNINMMMMVMWRPRWRCHKKRKSFYKPWNRRSTCKMISGKSNKWWTDWDATQCKLIKYLIPINITDHTRRDWSTILEDRQQAQVEECEAHHEQSI